MLYALHFKYKGKNTWKGAYVSDFRELPKILYRYKKLKIIPKKSKIFELSKIL